uniref:Uncharacterized protein n=1 Tax=Otus sunia TaxID=257818 RepID=A0A8C8ASD1_9STRI
MANTRFLSLCAYGRVTGLAVEAGAGVSHVTSSCLVAGGSLPATSVLLWLHGPPRPRLPSFSQISGPNGYWITLDKGWFCPEPLFQLKLLHQSSPGLPPWPCRASRRYEHTRRDMVGNATLSGSSSMFPSFPKRMCLELNTLFHGTESGTAAWAGGSRASSTHGWQRASTGSTGRAPLQQAGKLLLQEPCTLWGATGVGGTS